jgi:hypothetical protein
LYILCCFPITQSFKSNSCMGEYKSSKGNAMQISYLSLDGGAELLKCFHPQI